MTCVNILKDILRSLGGIILQLYNSMKQKSLVVNPKDFSHFLFVSIVGVDHTILHIFKPFIVSSTLCSSWALLYTKVFDGKSSNCNSKHVLLLFTLEDLKDKFRIFKCLKNIFTFQDTNKNSLSYKHALKYQTEFAKKL